ncbi:MAG: T9SS type A sorting domain-containing protein [Taibaiella sp.]|nr:T9SS type A sorting domain-containing protein [Taibaiella sp.]
MLKYIAFILLLLCGGGVRGQALHVDSNCFLPTDKCCAEISSAIPTTDKGIFFIGAMVRKPGGGVPFLPIDTVMGNVMVGKLDSNRQLSWVKVFGGRDDDLAFKACQTPDGGYAVLALTLSNDGDVTGNKGGGDIWLLRTDANGNLLWQKTYGSSYSDDPISIANTADHGFIILGTTNGSDGDVPFHYGGFFSSDWLVIKTDSTGNVLWTKNIGGTESEGNRGQILAVDSFYYLIGSTASRDYDCIPSSWQSGADMYDDYYVIKLNDTGAVLWDSSYGGSRNDEAESAMIDRRDNTIMITGTTYSNDHMVTDYNGGNGDIWVVKVKMDGTLVWQKALGITSDETGSSLCITPPGEYIICGNTRYVIGGGDGWLSVLDTTGNEIYRKIFGGIENEAVFSIVQSKNGYAAAGGSASDLFTEGLNCNANNSGSFISYFERWPLSIPFIAENGISMIAYPNPVNKELIIKLPNAVTGSITVLNSIGQTILVSAVERESCIKIPVENWSTGLYFLSFQSESKQINTIKILKN